jgi:hypothetical protein
MKADVSRKKRSGGGGGGLRTRGGGGRRTANHTAIFRQGRDAKLPMLFCVSHGLCTSPSG